VTKEVKSAYDKCHKLTAKYIALHQRASELCVAIGMKPPPLWLPQHLQGSIDGAAAAAGSATTPSLSSVRRASMEGPPQLDIGSSRSCEGPKSLFSPSQVRATVVFVVSQSSQRFLVVFHARVLVPPVPVIALRRLGKHRRPWTLEALESHPI
jgi:hypothetical protein